MMETPRGWHRKLVGDLFQVQLGKMLNSKARDGGDQFPYLTNFNVQWGRFDLDRLNRMHFSEKEREKFSLRSGDLIMCEGGEVGRCSIWEGQLEDCFYQKALHRLRPIDGQIEPSFMLAFMERIAGTKWLGDLTSGSSIAHLTREKLMRLPVLLPPIEEQQKVSSILECWNTGIRDCERVVRALSRRKGGLMQQLLSGEKRLPGFTEEWQEVKLGEILEHVFRPVDWAPDKIFNLISIRRRSGGLFRREPVRGDEYKTKDLHEIREGDFLISKRQVSHGALAMVRKEFHGCHVSKEYTILENKDPARLHMPFFDWLSRTKRMWWLTYVASNGVVIEKLIFAPQDFLKFTIKIPPTIEEQERIVELLETCDREIALHRRQLEAIREQKRGLMQKLLTGEVRVNATPE